METLPVQRHLHSSQRYSMNPISKFRPPLGLASTKFRRFYTSSPNLTTTQKPICGPSCSKSVLRDSTKVITKVRDAQLKEDWLKSISCPFTEKLLIWSDSESDVRPSNAESGWLIGVDPDVSGALALLKNYGSGCSAQVFDSPHLKVLVGKRIRRRLDTKSIVQLLQSLDAPIGTTAYIEQSIPFPQDGKQGWWSGGFGYGLWIGILVASGFSVVPVPSLLWKNEFKLSGNHSRQ